MSGDIFRPAFNDLGYGGPRYNAPDVGFAVKSAALKWSTPLEVLAAPVSLRKALWEALSN